MRIAVLGAGDAGLPFGPRLAAAGHAVTCAATGAMPVDAILYAGPLRDTEAAAAGMQALLAEGGIVVPLQNGVESSERIAAVVGAGPVLGGIAGAPAAPGEPISFPGTAAACPRLQFGVLQPTQGPAAEALLSACRGAGIDAHLLADIRRAAWEKFVFDVGFSGLTTIAGQPIGAVLADPELRTMLEAAMVEAWALARARAVVLADDFVATRMRLAARLPADAKSPMLDDLVAGRPLEAPWLCGAVARLAKESLVAAPVNGSIYAALKPYCDGRRP